MSSTLRKQRSFNPTATCDVHHRLIPSVLDKGLKLAVCQRHTTALSGPGVELKDCQRQRVRYPEGTPCPKKYLQILSENPVSPFGQVSSTVKHSFVVPQRDRHSLMLNPTLATDVHVKAKGYLYTDLSHSSRAASSTYPQCAGGSAHHSIPL